MPISTIKSYFKSLAKYPIPIAKRELSASQNGAKVLINSRAKSGTFLLRRTLSLMPNFVPRWSYHGLRAGTPKLHHKIANIRSGQYVSGHLHWTPEIGKILTESEIRVLFIIRDLRDIVVSLADYLTYKNEQHRLHPYFKSLESDDKRLMAAILGVENGVVPDVKGEKSIGESAKIISPWLREPNCLIVRFEDLIGSNGGGSEEKQLASVKAISNYLALDLSQEQIIQIAQNIFFQNSTTFRKGQIGDWQNHFTDEHKRVFKKIAGEALIELGYEKGLDW